MLEFFIRSAIGLLALSYLIVVKVLYWIFHFLLCPFMKLLENRHYDRSCSIDKQRHKIIKLEIKSYR